MRTVMANLRTDADAKRMQTAMSGGVDSDGAACRILTKVEDSFRMLFFGFIMLKIVILKSTDRNTAILCSTGESR